MITKSAGALTNNSFVITKIIYAPAASSGSIHKKRLQDICTKSYTLKMSAAGTDFVYKSFTGNKNSGSGSFPSRYYYLILFADYILLF